MRTPNGTIATSIQEIRSAPIGGGPRVTPAPAGADALACVCRGLFGGAAHQQVKSRRPMLDETAEIAVRRRSIPPLASAA